MTAELTHALEQVLGRKVTRLTPVSGGDINDAYRLELEGGARLFVKTREGAAGEAYLREAEGLAWLAEPGALRVPRVEAVSDTFLVLEWIDARRRGPQFDEAFGRGLAALHRAGAPSFGFAHDNFIGPLTQPNAARPTWSAFYAEQRLLPMLHEAKKRGFVDADLERRFSVLLAHLPTLVGPDEPPSRLHGDLWSGNVMCDEQGAPVLIDPAVYGGSREVDLAMLQLFGSPSERFFAAYDEVYPRLPGYERRVALYQLYPLLVHLCLFGATYRSQLNHALGEALQVA
jgi:fructosamine-3-kinase